MKEFNKLHGKRRHHNACVQLDVEPPKKSIFYGWNPHGPVMPTRSKDEKSRIKDIKRALRGRDQLEEQVIFVYNGVPGDIKYGSPIPNPEAKLPNEALRDYLNGLNDEERNGYVEYQQKLLNHYEGPGGP